jgi:hypothetical protein
MLLDTQRVRALLQACDLERLFIEELGWNRYAGSLAIQADAEEFALTGVAQKCGVAAFVCGPDAAGRVPDSSTRRRVERLVTKQVHEHLIVYTDARRATHVWQWVRRERGKPTVCREHRYDTGQPGDSLIQRLSELVVSLQDEENLTLPDVTGRTRRAFDVERVTKRFYERFREEHKAFLGFLQGIPDGDLARWYVSVMLNRLMFVYFIQKKGFLAGDERYLSSKLAESKTRGLDRYYRGVLCPLFFEGFAKRPEERSEPTRGLLGEVPYLNGGIFLPHQIEKLHGRTIEVPDAAFERLFAFFDAYRWHLDERPCRNDNEINPDVLGYIFEKYVNQKQMGAYYTKEDITDYIGKNTVIPFLLDAARERCRVAFDGEHSVWRLLRDDPDRCIYPAVRKGTELPLPPEIAVGIEPPTLHQTVGEGPVRTLELRQGWNRPAPAEFALPTETWRVVVARRKRYWELLTRLTGKPHSEPGTASRPAGPGALDRGLPAEAPAQAGGSTPLSAPEPDNTGLRQAAGSPKSPGAAAAGAQYCAGQQAASSTDGLPADAPAQAGAPTPLSVTSANDLITLNLDIRQFAQDVIETCEGPDLLVAIWRAIQDLAALDPTCGSGAFLFAVLNLLEPLYEACLDRMQLFLAEWGEAGRRQHPNYGKLFADTLARVDQHPNRRHFVLKSIMVNNLYGVDIMEEAVEICKLRLFLKLVAQIDRVEDLEPLPDIDFNIRAGNTLVGFATYDEVRKALAPSTDTGMLGIDQDRLTQIDESAEIADRAFQQFQRQQTELGGRVTPEDKQALSDRLRRLADELDRYLAESYGVDTREPAAFAAWRKSHQPFHWFAEFYGIIKKGGFGVILGNPPYVEKSRLGGIYAVRGYFTDRCPDMYAWVVERAAALLCPTARFGMIVPVSFTSSGAFSALRDIAQRTFPSLWLSHFSNRPGQLFTGAQNRLTVIVSGVGRCIPRTNATRYHRRDARRGERDVLFQCLAYVALEDLARDFGGIYPKVGSPAGVEVLRKVRSQRRVAHLLYAGTGAAIHWVRVPGYFCQFMLNPPMARPENGGPAKVRGEVLSVTVSDDLARPALHSWLNSSTFCVFYAATSDGRHINPSDVKDMPLGPTAPVADVCARLTGLSRALDEAMRKNTSLRRKSGLLIESVDSAACKPIIDEIDRVLARHYGFTEEELDFIINYDIKYRLGQDAGEEGDEE